MLKWSDVLFSIQLIGEPCAYLYSIILILIIFPWKSLGQIVRRNVGCTSNSSSEILQIHSFSLRNVCSCKSDHQIAVLDSSYNYSENNVIQKSRNYKTSTTIHFQFKLEKILVMTQNNVFSMEKKINYAWKF